MCLADLNVSMLQCQHRWYHLIRSCTPTSSLLSCASGKLALEGWEIKCDFCPFCAGWPLDGQNFRLVGADPRSDSLSRTPSLTTSLTSARRDSRRGSLARSDSSGSFTMYAAPAMIGSPITQAASEKNRAQNSRIDAYLEQLPEHIAETARRPESTAYAWNGYGGNQAEPYSPTGHRGSESSGDTKTSSGVVQKKPKRAKRLSSQFQAFFR